MTDPAPEALWLALEFPAFGLDRLLRGMSGGQRRLLAISDGDTRRPRIVHATAAAQRAGIEAGMPVSAAQALSDGLHVIERDPAAERMALEQLANMVYGYSSQVALVDDTVSPGLLLEVGGSQRLFGPAATLATRLERDLAGHGWQLRSGIAPTPDAARVAARNAWQALDMATMRRHLATTPLNRLPLDPAARRLLAGAGLRTLGDVLRLPRKALARRLGPDWLGWLDRLLGRRPARLKGYQPPARFHTRLDLPAEVSSVRALLFPLQRLLGDLCATLRAHDRGVQFIVIECLPVDPGPAVATVELALRQVIRDRDALMRLVRERCERLRLDQPVSAVALRAERLLAFAAEQEQLFGLPGEADAGELDSLLERLQARLGQQALTGLDSRPDHRPERAWDERDPRDSARGQARACRPAWLLPRPRPCRIEDCRILAGPERIETGWWDGGDCRRDYYVIAAADGTLLWAFRAYKPQPGWFVHGVFG